MRIFRWISTVLAAAGIAAGGAAPAFAAGPAVEPFIVGGSTVSSAPWAAAVFVDGQFNCSGTIIASRWVLTAKHCLGSGMTVRVGSVYRSSGGVTATVTRQVANPSSDFALLQLGTSISTTYARLAGAGQAVGSTNSIYGWGRTSYDGSAAEQLKTATVRNTRIGGSCTDAYGGRAICSTGVNGVAWKGDSGGPQMANGVQVGVASMADGSSSQIYGSVAANRSWITRTAGV
ncbi:S1 family peptidase [Amycolatopsis ruanii]|uniref:S1 family peptidase n=1 Tax=Amycolatopsis ruanii TaxID=944491 RepID=UPI000E28864F|nr:DUF1986 domain-containing protein [Amycolatopsis ruanii]